MAFDALKHRDVAEIYRVFERLIGLVTGFALAIRQAAEVNRVLHRYRLRNSYRTSRIRQDRDGTRYIR